MRTDNVRCDKLWTTLRVIVDKTEVLQFLECTERRRDLRVKTALSLKFYIISAALDKRRYFHYNFTISRIPRKVYPWDYTSWIQRIELHGTRSYQLKVHGCQLVCGIIFFSKRRLEMVHKFEEEIWKIWSKTERSQRRMLWTSIRGITVEQTLDKSTVLWWSRNLYSVDVSG